MLLGKLTLFVLRGAHPGVINKFIAQPLLVMFVFLRCPVEQKGSSGKAMMNIDGQ